MAYERACQNVVTEKVSLSYNKNSLSGVFSCKRKVIAHFKPAKLDFLQNLVSSMPTRMQEVFNRNRDMTKYLCRYMPLFVIEKYTFQNLSCACFFSFVSDRSGLLAHTVLNTQKSAILQKKMHTLNC